VGAVAACKPAPVTYVLVHGGGFAGSCWEPLRPRLDGPSIAVDLPGRGSHPGDLSTLTIGDFVAAVVDEIVSGDLTDVTLVGHSMAGLTLPGVAEAVPDHLRRLVFVSCSVPPQGTPLADMLGDLSPAVAAVADRVGDAVVDGRGALHPDLARAMFCNDMDEDRTVWTLDHMVPEAMSVLTEPVDLTGLAQPVPRTYVRLSRDASIDLEAQNRMIANLDPVDVVDLDAGHMVMVSRPDELARVLAQLS
jgi:pimeloyl-ACP methyl ester carboxylesterase